MKFSVIAALAGVLTLCLSVAGRPDPFLGNIFTPPLQPTCNNAVADVVFVLDESGSVKLHNFKKMRNFVKDIVSSFDIGRDSIRVGVVKFNYNPTNVFYLKKYYTKNDIIKAIDRIPYKKGSTYTHKVLNYLRTSAFKASNGDRQNAPNIAIVITDGKSKNATLTAEAARKLRKENTIVFAIGIGKGIEKAELNTIGSSPSREYVFSVDNFDVLKSIEKELVEKTCGVEPCDTKPCQNGGVCKNSGKTYSCLCKGGFSGKNCSVAPPPQPIISDCICRASGDPHYRTFDGQTIHFMGACKYTLTSTKAGFGLPTFHVEVKNEYRGKTKKVSYTRFLDIKLNGVTLRLLPKHKISVNNELLEMPLENYMGFTVRYSAGWVTATTVFGLQVKFDGNQRAIVKVPSLYRGKLTGICGDCNGKKDDWRTKTGNNVSGRRNKYALIGQSYEVPDDSNKPMKSCMVNDTYPTCSASVTKICNYMINTNDLFGKCVKKLGDEVAKHFYESCKIDVCAYKDVSKTLKGVKCRSFEAFIRKCEEVDVIINWRKVLGCSLDCSKSKNMIYKFKIQANQPTCANKTPALSDYSTDGCICMPGYVLSGTECVLPSQCGCIYDGTYIKAKETILLNDCSKAGTCKEDGKYVETTPCPIGFDCLVEYGKRVCKCPPGFAPLKGVCKDVIDPPPKPIVDPDFTKPVMHMFTRVTVAYIEGTVLEETNDTQTEICAHRCLKNKKCKSFNYDELVKRCQLFGFNAATTVTLTPSECPYRDYYQLIESKNVVINGASIITCVHLAEFGNINTEKECKAKCLVNKCKAMEFSQFNSECSVTHNDPKTYGLVGDDFWTFSVTMEQIPTMPVN